MDSASLAVGFVTMLMLLAVGLPVAVVMVLLGVIGGGLLYGSSLIDSMGSVLWSVQNENVLTAIPLFVLLGELLLRSGIADKMYETLSLWLGRLPGGLLHTNIGCCALFAATSGSSVATAATIGTVALPSMHRHGYSTSRALGSLAAGGTLGILIPPSVNLLVYGSLANVSIGRLFVAGILPGLLLTACFMIWIAMQAWLTRVGDEPAVVRVSWRRRLVALRHLLPPILIFALVMGSIYLGIATPTESAALAVIAALAFAAWTGRLSLALLDTCFRNTARTTGMILLIIAAAFLLNVTLALGGIASSLTRSVAALDLPPEGLLVVFVVFYVVLGMFLDVLSMQVLTVPIALPIVTAAGIDPIWFGVFVVLMCELGMITPPVGMNLYVVQGVRRDGGPFRDVVVGAVPYVIIMLLFAGLLIAWPALATWLPDQM